MESTHRAAPVGDFHFPNVRLPRRLIGWTRARHHVPRMPISHSMSKTGPSPRLANPFCAMSSGDDARRMGFWKRSPRDATSPAATGKASSDR
jgi:hypothetical protein